MINKLKNLCNNKYNNLFKVTLKLYKRSGMTLARSVNQATGHLGKNNQRDNAQTDYMNSINAGSVTHAVGNENAQSDSTPQATQAAQVANGPSLSDCSPADRPLVIRPFVRSRVHQASSESKPYDPPERSALQILKAPLRVPCPYCDSLLRMRSHTCSHCQRGLLNYWLWERAILNRLLLLMGTALLLTLAMVKIFIF